MGIKKKFFILSAAAMLSILILTYIIIYFYLYHAVYAETIVKQRATVELNKQIADNFLKSVTQTAIQVSGDKLLGECLSVTGANTLNHLKSRNSIHSQFSHYATHQFIGSNYRYRNTLFLSDQIPISSSFEEYTLNNNPFAASSAVFSNANVKDEEWYQETIKRVTYVFNNLETNELCVARKLYSSYYTGPASTQGHAVMVFSISHDQLAKVFADAPVTAHSGYAILNSDGDILFSSDADIGQNAYKQAFTDYQKNSHIEFETTTHKNKYLTTYSQAAYGIQFLFLTPAQDVAAGIQPLMNTFTIISTMILLFSLLVIYFLINKFTSPLIKLSSTIGGIQDTRIFNKASLNVSHEKELVVLQNSFSQMIDNTNRLMEDIQLHSEHQKRSQLRALQAQINPHFIFNAMDMVNWLALTRGCDDIANIVDSIASLMRYSITEADSMVSIAQEMLNIHEFVSIYQLRHNNEQQLLDQTENANIAIPKFTLQPLVENSIRHAKPPVGQKLVITVRAWQEDDLSIIEVNDNGSNGDAMRMNLHLCYEDSGLKLSSGFGIRNVNERIGLWFSDTSGLSYYNQENCGLTARIVLSHKTML